jgi:SPP1 gp7 family putative phage head morphogenesis protein
MRDGRKIGHITGFDDTGHPKGDLFHIYRTEIASKADRGAGFYQRAVQEIADKYRDGAYVFRWEASESLRRALAKMPTFEADEDRLHIRPTSYDRYIIGMDGKRPSAPTMFHTPGGVGHDQKLHGNWSDGSFAPSEAAGLLAAAIATGGFTYQPHEHANAPPVGYAMSMDVANEQVIPLAEATAEKIAAYIEARAALFNDKDTYVGAWIDTASGKLVLDVSKVVRDRNEALHLARTYKQEAIYDLEKGESIKVGAQGDERRFAVGLLRHRPSTVQPANHVGAGDCGSDHGASEKGAGRVVAATPSGKPRVVSMAAFDNAVKRVDFAVIDKRSDLLSGDAAAQMARQVAKATLKALGGETRIAELLTTDIKDIEYLKLDGADVGKLKAIAKDALAKAWAIGAESARRELAQAKAPPLVASFKVLAEQAIDYFEANGFRMAANVSDGTRAIIQQVLIQSLKEGIRPEDVTPAVFRALIDKGFTTFAALELEMLEPGMIAKVGKLLRLPATMNVPAYLNTLVRTNIFEALNEARFAEFTNPILENFVQAFEYTAILDDRTTELCSTLDGMIFTADSPEWDTYQPPNHYNCRSMLIPITETDTWWDGKESDSPTVMPADGFTTITDKQERAREAAQAKRAAEAPKE